jgi:hypothetical protein
MENHRRLPAPEQKVGLFTQTTLLIDPSAWPMQAKCLPGGNGR